MGLYEKLFVARYGIKSENDCAKCNKCKNDSFMKTNKITQIINKNNIYKFNGYSFENTVKANLKYCTFNGIWQNPIEKYNPTNILGGIGLFITDNELCIPCNEGTSSNYRLYGCHIIDKNEELIFETNKDMPIFEMEVGASYVKDYIFNSEYANGMYLEYHNTPHVYVAHNTESAGYLILVKKINDNKYMISALTVPYGKAIYLPPYTIHNDCFLIGKYNVMYNLAEDYSTVRLVNKENLNEFTNIILI
jgi:hypothetical protein